MYMAGNVYILPRQGLFKKLDANCTEPYLSNPNWEMCLFLVNMAPITPSPFRTLPGNMA